MGTKFNNRFFDIREPGAKVRPVPYQEIKHPINNKLMLSALTICLAGINGPVVAEGGDFANTDFAAAAPFTYNHETGGGAYNDRTVGDFNDVTEQLEGGQFTCGDIVTYLAQVRMEATTVDPLQTAEFDFRFLGNSTGQRGAGQVDIVNVAVNYGQVENGDSGIGANPGVGAFGLDSGINDDGGSSATLVSETFVGTPFQSGAELLGTVEITDLEPGEEVVLRIDVELGCEAGTSPTGNLQGQLDGGRVVYPDGTTDTINTGQQTIPFLKVGEIIGAGEPLLNIDKTVTTSSGTCGVDDVETLSAFTGDTVKYCYTISNPGTADLIDVEVVDDNGTPGDMSDDFTITLGVLPGVSEVTKEKLVTLPSEEGTVTNIGTASGSNGLSGGNFQVLTASDTANVELTLAPNNPPVAEDDSASTAEDTPVIIDALENDSDLDQDALVINSVSDPSHGTVVINPDGTLAYTPNPDYNGPDSFTYEVCDSSGACDTATVSITVTPVNDPPVAEADGATIDQDTQITINATDNDTDIDDNLDPITADVVIGPSSGSVTDNGDGTFTYEPYFGFFGVDNFDYQVCDLEGLCDTATVTITVLEVVPVNNPPVANEDNATTQEDTAVEIDAAGNDVDSDGNLNASSVNTDCATCSEPESGILANNGDGTFTYTPNADFNGTDSFVYEVCDTEPLCDTTTVTITVLAVNDVPVANDDHANTPEDEPVVIPVLDNDSDIDGDSLTVTEVSEPPHGTVSINADGTLTYTPDADFHGEDSFTYTVCDGSGDCDTATVNVSVTPVNDPPVAGDDYASTDEDVSVLIDSKDNDSDIDGNLDPTTASVVSGPSNGTVTNNGDGTFDYTPAENFNGSDSFEYQICDTDGLCDTAEVTIDVASVNDPPVAENNTYTNDEDVPLNVASPGVLDNDSDLDGDSLTVSSFTQPANGTLVQNPDGSLSYTPNANFNGDDSYSYTISDGNGGTDTAQVYIIVGAVNDAPVAGDDNYSVDEDTTLTVPPSGILSNDSDADGDTLTVNLLTGPSNGELTQNADGSFIYTPDPDYNGEDSFAYEVCDTYGVCDTATVTITVNPVNDNPVAMADSFITTQDSMLETYGVLENDYDPDGDALYVESYDQVSQFGGSVVVNPDGSLNYTPEPGFAGYDTFSYTTSDGNGGYDTVSVNITVEARNNRSISVDLYDFQLAGTILSGGFTITNQSGNYDVQVDGLAIEVQYKVPGSSWTFVTVIDESCSFTPEMLFMVENQRNVSFSGCELSEEIPEGATVRVTAKVHIFGRIKGKGKDSGWFLSRLSY